MEKTKKSQTEGKKMIDDFMYVLENYTDANLHSEAARRMIAEALVKYMCEHHIVTFTDLEGVRNDPAMEEFIKNCGCKANQMDIPFEKGL